VFFAVDGPGRDIRHLLPRVCVPTLVFHGENDRIVPVDAGRWVARQIPLAALHAFKGCGHLPAFTAPDEVAQVIRTFLTSGPRPVPVDGQGLPA
jgi:pimeloyl-ACP methyl ester carboxylesterase